MVPGAIPEVGPVRLELTKYAHPCQRTSLLPSPGDIARVSHKVRPGWSRLYASVLEEGEVRVGDTVHVLAAAAADRRQEGRGEKTP